MKHFLPLAQKLKVRPQRTTEKTPTMLGEGLHLIQTVDEPESILDVSLFETDTVSLIHSEDYYGLKLMLTLQPGQ
jgi:hypothetical protein